MCSVPDRRPHRPHPHRQRSRSASLPPKRRRRKADLQRARRVIVSFQVEDGHHQVMDGVRDLAVDIEDAAGLEKLLLRLNIALNTRE